MDCIQCGERKGFRKATATARMARPRPPHAGGPAGPVCLWARPMPRTPHHPRARRHPPPKDDCTRRPVAPAAILSIALSAPSLPSCRAARRMPRVCAACSHTLNRASWYQDGARFNVWQRLWHSYIPNGDVPRAAWQAPLTSPSIAWPPRRPSVHMFSFVHDSVWHLVSFRRTPCRQRPVAGSGHGILLLGDKPFFLRGGVLLRVLRAARTRARHITPADVEQMGNSRYARSTSCITMWRYWIRILDRGTIVVLRV